MSNDKIEEIRARHEEGIRAGADDDRAALLAEVERLRGALAMAAGYVRYCHDAWHETRDLAEAWRDLTKMREVLNDERAGELEGKA